MRIRVSFEDRVLKVPKGIDHLRGRDLDDAINDWLSEVFPNFDTGWELGKEGKKARREPADRRA